MSFDSLFTHLVLALICKLQPSLRHKWNEFSKIYLPLSMSKSFIFCRIYSPWMPDHCLELIISKTKLTSADFHPSSTLFSFIRLPHLPKGQSPCRSSYLHLKSPIALF